MDEAAAQALLDLAERDGPEVRGPNARATSARIEARYVDLLAAIGWFVDVARPDEARRLANALYPFWIARQKFEDGAIWFDRALASPSGEDHIRAEACINAGFMPFWQGSDDRASILWREGLEIARRLDDHRLTSQALGGLARVALRTDIAEGRRLAGQALDESVVANDRRARSNALHLLGVGAQMDGDLVEARRWMSDRLAVVREDRNDLMIASEAANLSMVERQLGNLDAAEALVRESLETSVRSRDEFTPPFALSGFAAIATERGEYERAAALVGAAEVLLERQGAAWPPDERPHYERTVSTLTVAMGPAGYERARAVGRALGSPEAVALALRTGPSS